MVKTILERLWREEEGQDLIEYALLVALLVLTAAASFPTIGNTINEIFTNANGCLSGTNADCTSTP